MRRTCAVGFAAALLLLCCFCSRPTRDGAPGPGAIARPVSRAGPEAGAYVQEGACAEWSFPGSVRWCVEFVVVRETGELELHCSWINSSGTDDVFDKLPDEGRHKTYIVDQDGRRYDHFETKGAAKFGARLGGRVAGIYTFRPSAAARPVFTVRDDEAKVSIPNIRLDPARRTNAEVGPALHDQVLMGHRVEIVRSSAGMEGGSSRLDTLRRNGSRVEAEWVENESQFGRVSERSGVSVLPSSSFQEFLEILADAPVLSGPHRPEPPPGIMEGSDHLSIKLMTGAEMVEFFTESRGTRYVPWAVLVKGMTYVVPSDAPMSALDLLTPFLGVGAGPALPARRALRQLPRPARRTSVESRQSEESSGPGVDLRLAAQRGDVAEVRRLLGRGVDVNARTPYDGETALTAAVLTGETEAVRILLGAGADPFLETPRGDALLIAITRGADDILALLTAAGERSPKRRSYDYGDAFEAAIWNRRPQTVGILLRSAGKPRSRKPYGTYLHLAARQGPVETIKLLVQAGAPVDAENDTGQTPLAEAAANGRLDVVRALLALGARVDGGSGGATALGHAARNGYTEIVRELITAGANLNAGGEWPPLMGTLAPEVVRVLIEAGANVNSRQRGGATPLLLALSPVGGRVYSAGEHPEGAPIDRTETVRLLIRAGASVNVADGDGRTPLMWATSNSGAPAFLRMLLDAGADVSARDKEGRTALFYAAAPFAAWQQPVGPWDEESVRLLLAAGGDPGATDRSGHTILELLGAEQSPLAHEILDLLGGELPALGLSVTVEYLGADVRGKTAVGAKVTLNGRGVAVRPDGSFSQSLSFQKPGKTTLVVRAVGQGGGLREERRTIDVPPSAFELERRALALLALADKHEAVRQRAAESLSRMGRVAEEAIPDLERALGDPSERVRATAFSALSRLGSNAFPSLMRALRSPYADVREKAVGVVGASGQSGQSLNAISIAGGAPLPVLSRSIVLSRLREALGDAAEVVRQRAVEGLMGQAAEEAIPDLEQALRDPSARVRAATVLALSRLGNAAIPTLVRALGSPNADVREGAASALQNRDPRSLGGAKVGPALVQALNLEDPKIRRWAAGALGRVGPDGRVAVQALANRLNDPDPAVRTSVVKALGAIGADAGTAAARLAEVLGDPRANRHEVALALGRIGPRADVAVPALSQTLKDPDPLLRGYSAWALGQIGPSASNSVSDLRQALGDSDAFVRLWAASGLIKVGSEPSTPLTMLMDGLKDPDWSIRAAAADRLGETGPSARASVPALTVALRDAVPLVRDAAKAAIAKIQPN